MSRRFITFMTRVGSSFLANPTVRVRINGLGLLCFSRLNNRAEVGFLKTRNPHPLILNIYDRNCNLIYPESEDFELPEGAEITINDNNPEDLSHPKIGMLYTPDNSQEPVDTDDRDFRHVPDLDALHAHFFPHAGRVGIKRNVGYLGKLFLSKGVFFNALRSTNAATVIDKHGNDKDLGKIGKVIGAELHDANVEVKITVNSKPFIQPITLKMSQGGPHTIIIRYKCAGKASAESDFERFHEALNSDPANELDISYDLEEPPALVECEQHLEQIMLEKQTSFGTRKRKLISRLLKTFRRSEEACQGSGKPECPSNLLGIPENCP